MQHVFKSIFEVYEEKETEPKIVTTWDMGKGDEHAVWLLKSGVGVNWSDAFAEIERIRELQRQFVGLGLASARKEGTPVG